MLYNKSTFINFLHVIITVRLLVVYTIYNSAHHFINIVPKFTSTYLSNANEKRTVLYDENVDVQHSSIYTYVYAVQWGNEC
jgi:hypothetical protein